MPSITTMQITTASSSNRSPLDSRLTSLLLFPNTSDTTVGYDTPSADIGTTIFLSNATGMLSTVSSFYEKYFPKVTRAMVPGIGSNTKRLPQEAWRGSISLSEETGPSAETVGLA